MKLNRLEQALLDETGLQLDLYIEDSKTLDIIADICEIRMKAALSTPAGELKQKILAVLNES